MIKYIVKFTYLKKVVTNGRRGTFSVLAFTTIFLQVNLIKKSKTSKKIFTVKPFLSSHPLLGSHCNVPETVALITVKLTCIKHSPLGCVPFSESKNGFFILDLPDFVVERNVKSEIGFVTLVTFRQRVQYARQPLKK